MKASTVGSLSRAVFTHVESYCGWRLGSQKGTLREKIGGFKEERQQSDGTDMRMEGEDWGWEGTSRLEWAATGQRDERELVRRPVTTKQRETCNSER